MADAKRTTPEAPPPRMTADEFLAWYAERPEGERYELLDGRVVRMAAGERVEHSLAKTEATFLLRSALGRDSGCRVHADGMAVRLPDGQVFEPDAMVRCGPPLPRDALVVEDPLIVLEVASPSSARMDTMMKRLRYFEAPSLVHYLVLDVSSGALIHERREPGAHPSLDTVSRVHFGGRIALSPPGIDLDLDAILEAIRDAEPGPATEAGV